jgi:hypothetical protein
VQWNEKKNYHKENKAVTFTDDIVFQYESIRSHILLDDKVLRSVGIEIFISRGIIGWSKMCSVKNSEARSMSDQPKDSSLKPPPVETQSEIISILANMSLHHLT